MPLIKAMYTPYHAHSPSPFSQVTQAVHSGNNVTVTVEDMNKNKVSEMDCDALLVCVGRKPYTDRLGLDNVGVSVDDRGRIPVNERFQTSQAKLEVVLCFISFKNLRDSIFPSYDNSWTNSLISLANLRDSKLTKLIE